MTAPTLDELVARSSRKPRRAPLLAGAALVVLLCGSGALATARLLDNGARWQGGAWPAAPAEVPTVVLEALPMDGERLAAVVESLGLPRPSGITVRRSGRELFAREDYVANATLQGDVWTLVVRRAGRVRPAIGGARGEALVRDALVRAGLRPDHWTVSERADGNFVVDARTPTPLVLGALHGVVVVSDRGLERLIVPLVHVADGGMVPVRSAQEAFRAATGSVGGVYREARLLLDPGHEPADEEQLAPVWEFTDGMSPGAAQFRSSAVREAHEN